MSQPSLRMFGSPLLFAALVIVAAACGGGEGDAATTTSAPATTADVTTTEAETTTTVEVSTTAAETTTTTEVETTTTEAGTTVPDTAAPTTVPPAPGGLVLRAEGVGTFDFFVTEAFQLLPALEVLGPIVTDVYDLYESDGSSGYVTPDGEIAYTYPFGREVCYANGFCVELGGAAAPIVFTGWRQGPPTSGSPLATAAGITVGSRWSDNLERMDAFEGGCYSSGSGLTRDGVQLGVVSSGTFFGDFTSTGEYVSALPPANQVTVDSLYAGELKVFLFADC